MKSYVWKKGHADGRLLEGMATERFMNLLREQGWDPEGCSESVPYYDCGVRAGIPSSPGDYCGECVMVPVSLLKDCDMTMRVRGWSMRDAGIDEGDMVLVKKNSSINDGDIVVAVLDGEATLKTYCRDEQNHEWLVPANDDFSPIPLSDYVSVYYMGTVTKVMKPSPHVSYADMHRRLEQVRDRIGDEAKSRTDKGIEIKAREMNLTVNVNQQFNGQVASMQLQLPAVGGDLVLEKHVGNSMVTTHK